MFKIRAQHEGTNKDFCRETGKVKALWGRRENYDTSQGDSEQTLQQET